MTINYQSGAIAARGALIRARAALSDAEYRAVVRDVPVTTGVPWSAAARLASRKVTTGVGP